MKKVELKTIVDNKNKTKEYFINDKVVTYEEWKACINKYYTLAHDKKIKLGENYYTYCKNNKAVAIKTLVINK